MYIKVIVSSAVVSALIALLGTVISASIARKSAKETAQEIANKEIEKMKLSWQREDMVSSDEEFAEMASVVAKFCTFANGGWSDEAIEKVGAIRSKESGTLGQILDGLYDSVKYDRYAEADMMLTDAINEKRRIKSQAYDASNLQHQ